MRARFHAARVKRQHRPAIERCLLYPDERTSSDRLGMSVWCHEQTFVAPPYGALLFVVLNFARIRSDHASDSGWRDETVMGNWRSRRRIWKIRRLRTGGFPNSAIYFPDPPLTLAATSATRLPRALAFANFFSSMPGESGPVVALAPNAPNAPPALTKNIWFMIIA